MQQNNKKIKGSFPEKKDFIYWIVLLIIIIVIVSVWRVNDPKMLSDQIALGAALFSILLAVVGIIIPYIQGNETTRQNFQMLAEINKITESIVGMTSLKDELSRNITHQLELSRRYTEIMESAQSKIQSSKEEHIDKDELEQLQLAKNEMKEKMYELEQESLFLNNLPSSNPNTSRIKEKTILNYLKDNRGKAVPLTMLRIQLGRHNIPVGKPELHNIISNLEKKGLVSKVMINGEVCVQVQ